MTLCFKLFVKLLNDDAPRSVEANRPYHVVIIIDACYERESRELVCGLGGVCVDPQSGVKNFFSCSLGPNARNLLGEASKKKSYMKLRHSVACWRIFSGWAL